MTIDSQSVFFKGLISEATNSFKDTVLNDDEKSSRNLAIIISLVAASILAFGAKYFFQDKAAAPNPKPLPIFDSGSEQSSSLKTPRTLRDTLPPFSPRSPSHPERLPPLPKISSTETLYLDDFFGSVSPCTTRIDPTGSIAVESESTPLHFILRQSSIELPALEALLRIQKMNSSKPAESTQ